MNAPRISFTAAHPGDYQEPSYLDITFASDTVFGPAGTVLDGWCVNYDVNIYVPNAFTDVAYYPAPESAVVQASVTSLATSNVENLDSVSWLLNHYDGENYPYFLVQYAIWNLMGHSLDSMSAESQKHFAENFTTEQLDEIVSAATTQHGVYVPEAGQSMAVVLDPYLEGVQQQPLVVEVKAAQLGDYVWHDTDLDGIQDGDEVGIANVDVSLVRDMDGDGKFTGPEDVIAKTSTDASGHYAFKGLTPGYDYQVQFAMPEGFTASPRQAAGGLPVDNSDGPLSNVVTLAPGENNTSLDAGFYKLGNLGDTVWYDADRDGLQDAGETGVNGATVKLFQAGADNTFGTADDVLLDTQSTDADGKYLFTDLKKGVYQVEFSQLPPDYVFTQADVGGNVNHAVDSDANQVTGRAAPVSLAPGQTLLTVDAGVVDKLGSLGDTVWYDADRDGVQDAGEAGVKSATVKLYQAGADGKFGTIDDVLLGTKTTDASGKYLFTDLKKGDYQVEFSQLPADHVFTKQDAGGNDGFDSDASTTSGRTATVSLAAGESRLDVDAGVIEKLGRLGDTVWYDTDRDGVQDADEAGVKGATVKLYQSGADGKFGTADDALLGTKTTDASGKYLFTDLKKGDYQVEFSQLPADHVFTKQDAGGNDGFDSDANTASGRTATVSLAAGENNLSVDAGVIEKLGSLGDTVWYDNDRDGVQDAGEAGVKGATVKLYQSGADKTFGTDDDVLLATQTTDASGKYLFTDLKKGGFQVEFSQLPADHVFTKQDVGSSALDSDANTTTGRTDTISLAAGQNLLTVDAGVVEKLGSLGDTVWYDTDRDGVQDTGEAGVKGATVKLYQSGADGKFGTADDALVATQTTDASGKYLFTDLKKGGYQVEFSQLPADHVFTKQDAGGNDGKDSDANIASGRTGAVSLAAGENNLNVDAGVVEKLGSLGDTVWYDADYDGVQDAGEVGVAGVSVSLYQAGADGRFGTADDALLGTKSTDSAGHYLFTDLAKGDYQAVFSQVPYGYGLTTQNAYGQDGVDSDANVYSGRTATVSLDAGENDLSVDAGIVYDWYDWYDWYDYDEPDYDYDWYDYDEPDYDYDWYDYDEPDYDYDWYDYDEPDYDYDWYDYDEPDYDYDWYDYDEPDYDYDWYDYDEPDYDYDWYDYDEPDYDYDWYDYDEPDYDYDWYDDVEDSFDSIYAEFDNIYDSYDDLEDSWIDYDDWDDYDSSWDDDYSYSSSWDDWDADYSYDSSWDDDYSYSSSSNYWDDDYSSDWSSSYSSSWNSGSDAHEDYVESRGNTGLYEGGFLAGSPVALDLNDDGGIGVTGDTSSFQKDADAQIGRTVQFDIDADGALDTIEWYDGSGDGILIDNRDGQAIGDMDGERLFGDQGGKFANGYVKLAHLDADDSGAVAGDELEGLQLWVDNGDAVVQNGEIQTLTQHGIVEISTRMALTTDDEGREHMTSTATRSDGSSLMTEDVWFVDAGDAIPVSDLMADEGALDRLLGAPAPQAQQHQQDLAPDGQAEAAELLRKVLAAHADSEALAA